MRLTWTGRSTRRKLEFYGVLAVSLFVWAVGKAADIIFYPEN